VIGAGGFVGEASIQVPEENDLELRRLQRKAYPLAELTDVYVHPLRRGRGWAKTLAAWAVTYAQYHRLDLVLRVLPYGTRKLCNGTTVQLMSQAELTAFYASFGFKVTKADPAIMVYRCRS
jgi:GNAT superfamily N-acetyltransferase